MRFAEVQFLWLLFSLFFLALFFFYSYRRKKLLASRFVSLSMLPKVATSFSPWRRLIKSTLLLFALAFLILALARPQWGQSSNHIERKGLDLMLLQDVSSSMLAEDVKPNRLTRSKHEISAFLESLSGDRIALVAFSGEAELVLPLTLDYGAAQLALRDLEPGWLMPGTDLEAAIKKGIEVFKDSKTEAKYAVMVLMSDGEELQNEAVTAAKEASKLGIKIYTIGIGSLEGVPIPVQTRSGEVAYKKDAHGNIVTTRLEEGTLKEVASVTGAKYFYANPTEFQLQKVLTEIAQLEKKEHESTLYETYKDRYQVFLFLAMILFVGEFLVSERGRKKARPSKHRFLESE